jgi:hypothetical protein
MSAGFAIGRFSFPPTGSGESQTGAAAPGAMIGSLGLTLSSVASNEFPIARPALAMLPAEYMDGTDASLLRTEGLFYTVREKFH